MEKGVTNGKRAHGFRKTIQNGSEQYMRPINVEILMGHNIGVSASYYEPKEHEVLEDYLRASDHLTIGGDKKILEKQIYELTEKQDEITLMRLKHEKEMQEIRHQMNHIVSLIQEKNPKLAKVKTDILTRL